MTKFLVKRNLNFLPFWDHFIHFWAQMNLLKKLGPASFQILQLSAIIQKKTKKLMSDYREKLLTDRQINRQTGNGNFIGPSIYGGPKIVKYVQS